MCPLYFSHAPQAACTVVPDESGLLKSGIWVSVFCPQNNTSHLQTTGRWYLFPTLARPHLYHLSTTAQVLLKPRLHSRETTLPPCLVKQPSWGSSVQGCHDRVCSFTLLLPPLQHWAWGSLQALSGVPEGSSHDITEWAHQVLSIDTAFWQKDGSETVTNQATLSPTQTL